MADWVLIRVVVNDGSGSSSGVSWDWFLDKIAPPLVAGLAIAIVGSYLLPRANERYKGQREHIDQTVNDLREQLDALQKVASDYWASPPGPNSPVQEADIEYRLQDINSLLQVCGPEVGGASSSLMTQLALETVTADFGVPVRLPEPDRGRIVAIAAAKIASAAAIQRRRYFHETSMHRRWKSFQSWLAKRKSTRRGTP